MISMWFVRNKSAKISSVVYLKNCEPLNVQLLLSEQGLGVLFSNL